ncbi:hypothetical protein [Chitinophaga sp. Cy-1792]|uniref:hypothetical protein n=1 Tax=Chitinophaga sp. Cy-1792 TaxID=2608339 RepID=UPI00141DD84C|nr:hypothetical protein [Chitinophaga sp. Cy-1792]NIG54819.1 hypothetical protein [Chitinophaga sp. Cy-1792]
MPFEKGSQTEKMITVPQRNYLELALDRLKDKVWFPENQARTKEFLANVDHEQFIAMIKEDIARHKSE